MDFDGAFEYSSIKNIAFEKQGIQLNVYPNPTQDLLYIDSESDILSVTLFDAQEKNIITVYTFPLNMKNLPSGVYQLNVETNSGTLIKSVVKIIF